MIPHHQLQVSHLAHKATRVAVANLAAVKIEVEVSYVK